MKRLPIVIAIAVVLATALLVSSVAAGGNSIDINGPHYNLNLIGSKTVKNWDEEQNSNSHVIFVRLSKTESVNTQIYLREAPPGESYDVIDGNGADGFAAFQLPKPYLDETVDLSTKASECMSQYQIFVRVNAGKGMGSIVTKACTDVNGDDICTVAADGTIWQHLDPVPLVKNNKFSRVTHELTTVQIDGIHYGLFSDITPYGVDTYFWDMWARDIKNVQLRFYDTPSDYCDVTGYPA